MVLQVLYFPLPEPCETRLTRREKVRVTIKCHEKEANYDTELLKVP